MLSKCITVKNVLLYLQVKNHMWLFVNCLVENPTFDSQTKENMTLQQKSFGSTCPLSDKFIKQVLEEREQLASESCLYKFSWYIYKCLSSIGHSFRDCGKYHELGEV